MSSSPPKKQTAEDAAAQMQDVGDGAIVRMELAPRVLEQLRRVREREKQNPGYGMSVTGDMVEQLNREEMFHWGKDERREGGGRRKTQEGNDDV